jgi:PAP2 superfamily
MLQASSTYFCYGDEVYRPLINLRSSCCMDVSELCKWDEVAAKAIAKEKMSHHDEMRIYAYLYQAQADAATLSSQVSGGYVGNLGPVSSDVLALFVPGVPHEKGDAYSEKLAEIVVAKVKERVASEANGEKHNGQGHEYGLHMASWKPWHIDCPADYWPACPPAMDDPFWEWQICAIKGAQEPMTRGKKRVIRYWAGLEEPGCGDWRRLANARLFECEPSLEQAIEMRSVLMTGLYDTAIVCFGAKYHYMVKRPKEIDPKVEYIIVCPDHPSYPSGHSTEAGAAAAILSHFFPEDADQWCCWAQQSGESRIWAGIHYPIDDEAGQAAGRCVAEAVIARQ